MTPDRYAKMIALALDERADPATRAIAQKMVNKWKLKFEGPPKNPLHPGRRQTPEYQAWIKGLNIGKKTLE